LPDPHLPTTHRKPNAIPIPTTKRSLPRISYPPKMMDRFGSVFWRARKHGA